jgi:hypothetical protein
MDVDLTLVWLVSQVPEVADRILESAKKQRWELLQHIETLQTKVHKLAPPS